MTSELTDSDSSSDDAHLYVPSQDICGSKIPTISVMISEIPVDMIINTGISIDILDETAYHKVNYSGKITLQPSTKRSLAYGSKSQLNGIELLTDSRTISQFPHCMC